MASPNSGFRGTRAGVTTGAGLKNQGEDPLAERLPRIRVSYWCSQGHETQPVFVKLPEEQIPPEWDCRRCGRPASRNPGTVPGPLSPEDPENPEGYKSHLDYVKERRSSQDAEDVLAGALKRLRAGRGLTD